MKIFRVITLLLISFGLIFGNFANAAMFCCATNQSMSKMEMDSKAEMPCHKTTEKSDQKMQHDKNCADCKNCVSANVIIFTQPTHKIAFVNVIHNIPVNNFVSVVSEGIYSPPKQIS
jgi:hypothetical protein